MSVNPGFAARRSFFPEKMGNLKVVGWNFVSKSMAAYDTAGGLRAGAQIAGNCRFEPALPESTRQLLTSART
jgi:hypothetical protein